MTSRIRIDDELYASAEVVGSTTGRTPAQQLAHRARIGQEIESSASISTRAIVDVLAARRDYDQLNIGEQAAVRAEWAQQMDARRNDLDLAQEFSDQSRSYVELDSDGQVVHHGHNH